MKRQWPTFLRTGALVLAMLMSDPGSASLTAQQLTDVGVKPPADARLPLDARLTGLDGRTTSFGDAIRGRPAGVVFADYDCPQLCSPILALAGIALGKSGLEAGTDYRLVVIGFNPKATGADGERMVDGQIGFSSPVGSGDDRGPCERGRRDASHICGRIPLRLGSRSRALRPSGGFARCVRRRPAFPRALRPRYHWDRRPARVGRGRQGDDRRAHGSTAAHLLRLQRLGRFLCGPYPHRPRSSRRHNSHRRRAGLLTLARASARSGHESGLYPSPLRIDSRPADVRALLRAGRRLASDRWPRSCPHRLLPKPLPPISTPFNLKTAVEVLRPIGMRALSGA